MNAFEIAGRFVLDGAAKVSAQVEKIGDKAQKTADDFKDFGKRVDRAGDDLDGIETKGRRASSGLDKVDRSADKAGNGLRDVKTDADKAARGLDNVDDSADDAADGMEGFVESIGGATAKATALVAALGAMGSSGAQTVRELKINAQVSGTTRTEFQKLAYAAKTVGIENDKLGDIYKDMNDRVGDFLSTGGGPMKDFFEEVAPLVGVTADQFRNLSGPEALQLFTTSLEKAGLNSQEMTFYLESMASDATRLAPLLKNNGKEFKRLGEQAEKSGGIMSEKYLAITEDGSKAFNEMMASLGAIANKISVAVLPVFESIEPVITHMLLPAINFLTGAFVGLMDIINMIPEPIRAIGTAIGGLKLIVLPMIKTISKFTGSLGFISTVKTTVVAALKGLGAVVATLGAPFIAAFALLAGAVWLVIDQWHEFEEFGRRMWRGFKMWMEELFLSMGINIVNNISDLPNALLEVFRRAGDNVMNWFREFSRSIVRGFRDMLDKIPGIDLKASTAALEANMKQSSMPNFAKISGGGGRTISSSSSVTNIDMRNATIRNGSDMNDRLARAGSAPLSGF